MAKETKPPLIVIAGLGNPGEQYRQTPHNAGFAVVDAFAEKFEFPEFKMEPDGVLTSKKEISRQIVVLAKPQMLMNNSGKALARLFAREKIKKAKSLPNFWAINDDLDIPLGKIKISRNRSSAGHKGVQSIIDQFKTKNFARLRLGIAPKTADLKKIPASRLVLKKFTPAGQTEFNKAVDLAIAGLELALSGGIEKAMTEFNQ